MKKDTEKMVDAILKGDKDEAKKHLKEALKKKVLTKIRDTETID